MEATALSKIIVILGILGTIIFIVGFSTDYWWDNDISHSGLWRSCSHIISVCSDVTASLNIFEGGVCKCSLTP